MKNISVLKNHFSLFLLLLLVSPPIVQAHRPHDAIFALAISPQEQAENELICGLSHLTLRILRSKNSGNSWDPFQLGFTNKNVTALVYSPAFDMDYTVLLGTGDGRLYSSFGDTGWQMVASGLGSKVTSIAISPDYNNDRTIFAATYQTGIYKSTDGGNSWIAASEGLDGALINAIAVSPTFPQDQQIFAASNKGVYVSTEGGTNWMLLENSPNDVEISRISLSPTFSDDKEIFAGTYGKGVYRSSDAGSSWVAVNNGITDHYITSLAISPNFSQDRTVVVAGKDTGVFKSMDSGNTWQLLDVGLEDRTKQSDIHFRHLVFSPSYSTNRRIYAGMFEGLFRSDDGGHTWRQLNVYQPQFSRSVDISPNFLTDGKIVYSTYGGGIYRSATSGFSWVVGNTGLESRFVFSVAFSPDQSIYAVDTGNPSRLYRSENAGVSWKTVSVIDPNGGYIPTVHGFALSPDYLNDKTLFLGNRMLGKEAIYRSIDGGFSFTPINLPANYAQSIILSPNYSNDQILYVGTEKGIYKSFNRGDTWLPKGLDDISVWCLTISSSGNLFAGTLGKGIFTSSDGGETWHAINEGLPDLTIEDISISPDYDNDQAIYAATFGSGVYKTTDGGVNWQYSGLEGQFISKISVSPSFATDQVIFAATWDGIYCSNNRGDSWKLLSKIVRYEETFDSLFFDGQWQEFNHQKLSVARQLQSNNIGDRVTLPFWGTRVTWIGAKGAYYGAASIFLDGVFQEKIELYAPTRLLRQNLFRSTLLPLGNHEIVVEVAPSSNPGKKVSVDAFDIDLPLAKTIRVPGDIPSIQEAINAASDGDTIVIADGRYTGSGNIDLDFKGKAILVRSENGSKNCIIDCEGIGRGFYFHNGEQKDSIVKGFTIMNGVAPNYGDWPREVGGAIFCNYASPTIKSCVIKNNMAWRGGGIFLNYSSAIIINSSFTDNWAGNGGGGIHSTWSSPTIMDCTFNGNITDADSGGAIFCNHSANSPIISNCTIENNTAQFGGGISCYFSSPIITGCTIIKNKANRGGGIRCYAFSSPKIKNCSLVANTANKFGGGIFCKDSSSPTIINTIISGNTATTKSGGGIYAESAGPKIISSSVIGNNSFSGGGGLYSINGSTPLINNSIFWKNEAQFGMEIFNDVLSNTTVTYTDIDQQGYEGLEGNIRKDPLFIDINNQDPVLWDVHLQSTSPAIDAGTNEFIELTETDFDGDPRVFDGDGDGDSIIDMGADEYVF